MKADFLALAAVALSGSLAPLGVKLAHSPPFLLTGLGLLVGSVIALPLARQDGQGIQRPLLNGFAAQGLSRRAMVVQLDDLGIKAPRGGAWSLGQVQRIVQSR